MKLLQLYEHVLSTGGLSVDADGLVGAKIDNSTEPFVVEGKRLVLPTPEHLKNPDPENKIIFHPLSENILRGESKIISKFRYVLNARMNYVLSCLFEELMVIGTSVKMHSQLNPDQAELLSVLKDADEKTLAALGSLIEVVSNGEDKVNGFVYIYLKRGGSVEGKNFGRAAIVNFPLYEELIKEDKKVFGVTLRTKDKQMITKLFEFVFSKISTPGGYNKGSNDSIAPFFDALMQSVIQLAGCINDIVEKYKSVLQEADEYMYNSDWVEVFDNLAQLLPEIRSVPMQAGNEGTTDKETVVNTTTNVATLKTPDPNAQVQQTYATPVQQTQQVQQYHNPNQQQTVVLTESGGLDIAATQRANGGAYGLPQYQPAYGRGYPNQPQYGNMNQNYGYQQPQPYNQFPQNAYRPAV